MTLAEAIKLSDKLVYVPTTDRPLPDVYHARTGHVLPPENSEVFEQLQKTEDYANLNDMVINYDKTKLMVFNTCKTVDFSPEMVFGNEDQLQVVEEMKLLGVTIRSDLKWSSNTENMVKRALNKLLIIRRLKNLGANEEELVYMYIKQCRSILEFCVPVWHGAKTNNERLEIERVQKGSLHLILGEKYVNYKNALELTNLETLEDRRNKL